MIVFMGEEIKNFTLSIIMPAFNEEDNIVSAIDDTLSTFDEFNIDGEIVVINDGSTDATASLVKNKIENSPRIIRLINHAYPQGIGASFWDGVDSAKGNVVCMLPGDNENEPSEIIRYLNLLNSVDIVIPYVFNKSTRSLTRNALSFLYQFIINSTFIVCLNYTNGTVLYRKSILADLKHRCRGFFFQTDILIRLVKRGYLFAEVPYRLRIRKEGKSKAVSLKSLSAIIKGYLKLIKDIYFRADKQFGIFSPDSLSATRYKQYKQG